MQPKTLAAAFCLLLAACSNIQTTAKETEAMSHTTQQKSPEYTASEVLEKMLEFIRSANTPEDFKAKHVEKIFGIRMENQDKKYPGDFFFGTSPVKGAADWGWNINSFDTPDKNMQGEKIIKNHVNFGFFDFNESRDFSSICQTDLEQFHQSLVNLGMRYGYETEWGGVPYRTYMGKNIFIRIFYRYEKSKNSNHKCISGIHVTYRREY